MGLGAEALSFPWQAGAWRGARLALLGCCLSYTTGWAIAGWGETRLSYGRG